MKRQRGFRPARETVARSALPCALVFLILTTSVAAQTPPDPSAARIRLGPVALMPRLSLTNLGVDTNVFNEVESPHRDWTATFSPQVDAWIRLGPARVSARVGTDLVYFRQYTNQRGVNTADQMRIDVPLLRLTPYVSVAYLNSQDRPGLEIDARARHTERTLTAGTEVRLGPRLLVDLSARRTEVRFQADDQFEAISLHDVLNRRTEAASASLKYAVTPLTKIVVLGEMQRERFEFSPMRNGDSFRVMPGLEFDPRALVTGRAYVGYRRLDSVGPGVPTFTGTVATVGLGYTLLGSTRFAVQAQRDVQYSFELQNPHYVLTGVSGSISQHVIGGLEVVLTGGHNQLRYRGVEGIVQPYPGRIDTVLSYGGGLGYRLRKTGRLGIDAIYDRRRSPIYTREFHALRVGGNVTYGF